MATHYTAGKYLVKISHRAAPLGRLPAGEMFAVAIDESDAVWAAGDHELWCGSLDQGFTSVPYPERLLGRPSSLRLVQHSGCCAAAEIETTAGQLWRYVCGEQRWDPVAECEHADRNGRAQAEALVEVHPGAWLKIVDGKLCFVSRDGFVEPLPQDIAKPPIAQAHRALVAADGSLWLASHQGLCHLRGGQWEYFAGMRWLNSDDVRDIAIDSHGRLWAATSAGLCCIEYKLMTLAEKAAYFESVTRRRHVRNGYCCANTLAAPGDVSHYLHQASDNDGLWTALYVAAESFRYAATRDSEAQQFARESALALCWLEQVTPVPGLIARAAVRHDERVELSDGEWHRSPNGEWLWKGDASSDELDGHFFAYSVYYDLAADEESARVVAQTVERITDHLLEHGYFLVDVDGEPTTWGFFAPEWLNVTREDQRGLNSLELLAYLRTAHHICGHARYIDCYHDLIERHHYALNVVNQKVMWPSEVNFSDDELAFICYYPLLTYEDDPALRQLYLLSLERQWQAVRPQRCPLWNVIYGVLSGNPCDIDRAVESLAELPLDLVDWRMTNSHRNDVEIDDRPGRFGELQSTEIVPYDERADFRWNHNPYRLDGGGHGRTEYDGTHYLLPYWMARYHGLIAEETSAGGARG